jgi:hypothetical protein
MYEVIKNEANTTDDENVSQTYSHTPTKNDIEIDHTIIIHAESRSTTPTNRSKTKIV